MMNRDLVKAALGIVASAGVGVVVKNAIKLTTPLETSTLDKVLIGAGTIAISGMISNQAIKYTADQTDFIFDTIDKVKMSRADQTGTVVISEDSTDAN